MIGLTTLTGCVIALGFASMPASSSSAEPSAQLLQPVTTNDQVSALKPGSKVTMTCAKCKTVQIAEVDGKHGILGWCQPKTKDQCPGCGGTWQYVNVAKGIRGGYTHTCSKCGSKSVFCCGMRGGEM